MDNNFKYFKLTEIFSISRGKRQKKLDRITGNINYYSASSFNNGLTDRISNPIFKNENAILITTFGDCYYVEDEFTASDEITILKLKTRVLNKFIGLYLVGLLRQLKSKFSFGRKAFESRLKKEYIFIPVDSNNLPNWTFMESFIISRMSNISFSKRNFLKKYEVEININLFKKFKLTSIFNIRGSGKSLTLQELESGNYNYITTKATLNGIQAKSNKYTCDGNVITIDSATNGICFYQDKPFIASDHVEILIPKEFILNKWIALYIVAVLRQNIQLYSYARKRSQKRIQREEIFLPVNADGKPDWNLLELFMKDRANNIYF